MPILPVPGAEPGWKWGMGNFLGVKPRDIHIPYGNQDPGMGAPGWALGSPQERGRFLQDSAPSEQTQSHVLFEGRPSTRSWDCCCAQDETSG